MPVISVIHRHPLKYTAVANYRHICNYFSLVQKSVERRSILLPLGRSNIRKVVFISVETTTFDLGSSSRRAEMGMSLSLLITMPIWAVGGEEAGGVLESGTADRQAQRCRLQLAAVAMVKLSTRCFWFYHLA